MKNWLTVALVSLCGLNAWAAVRIVGDPTPDYVTIQNAIDNAGPMAHIMVTTGVYAEVLYINNFFDDGVIIDGNWRADFSGKVAGQTIVRRPDSEAHGTVINIYQSKNVQLIDLIVTRGRGPASGHEWSGGGIHIDGDSQAELVRCRIVDNHARGYGGGIYVTNSALRIVDSHIYSNHAHNATAGDWRPEGCGGGIAVQNGTLEIDGENWATISRNAADHTGGAIYLHGGSQAILTGFVDVLTNVSIFGGGLAVTEGSSLELLDGPYVCGNTATQDGGGIWMAGGSTGRISGAATCIGLNHIVYGPNRALGAKGGGGIYVQDSYLILSNKAAVAHNMTAARGGGIHLADSVGVISEAYVGWPDAMSHTNSAMWGGGIYVVDSHLNLTNNAIIGGNHASNEGGGIHILRGTAVVYQASVRHNHGTVRGGGIYAEFGRVEAVDSLVVSNTTAGTGAGAHVWLSHVILDGCDFRHNTAGTSGGGLYAVGSTAILTNSSFSHNHADQYGGGLALISAGSAFAPSHLSRMQFDHNTANGDGGGMWITNSTVFVNGLDALNNRANADDDGHGNGGAIWHAGSRTLDISSGGDAVTINENRARHGGGLYATGDTIVHIHREETDFPIVFDDNTASGFGGGMAARSSAITLRHVKFLNNVSGLSGGGADIHEGSFSGTNILFRGNRSTTLHGGGFSGVEAAGHLAHLQAVDNEAFNSGGGGMWENGHLFVDQSTILSNRALTGGGCALRDQAEALFVEVSLEENQSTMAGGGLFLSGLSRLTATNLNLLGNRTPSADASNRGGGMCLVAGSRASLQATGYGSSVIRDNEAFIGGGIHAEESWIGLSGNILMEENIAGHSGGALDLWAGTGVVNRVYMLRNEADSTGAGISAEAGSMLLMENTLLAEGRLHTPMRGGGLDLSESMAFMDLCTVVHNDEYGIYQWESDVWVSDSLIYYNQGPSVAAGVAVQYSNVEGGHPGTGNFDAPPLLYEGNYHLTAWSPCRGAGQMAGLGHFDVDGEVRPEGEPFDIGFDHFQDSDGDGLPDIVETGTGVMVSDLDMGTDPFNPDTSGNNMSDGEMWLAGMDPNDPDSRLELIDMVREDDDVRVTWRGGTLADQILEYTTDLTGDDWHLGVHLPAPTDVQNDHLFIGAENPVLFRLRASRFGF